MNKTIHGGSTGASTPIITIVNNEKKTKETTKEGNQRINDSNL